MDRSKKDWSWVKEHMPELVRELAEWRADGMGAHIDLCWRHGVLLGEPDWFYAREGPLSLGTPFRTVGPVATNMRRHSMKVHGYSLLLREMEVSHVAG
jgi:hypothetical protein